MNSVTIIVPVKDEEVGLQYLLENLLASKISIDFDIDFIFVIDDRTSDDSHRIASEFSDHIIDQEETYGKGNAMKRAITHLDLKKTNFVIFLDADGSYSFNGVRDVLNSLEGGAEVVSGSRFLNRSGRPNGMGMVHTFGNRLLSMISSIRNRRKISDLCTGLWGFKADSLIKMDLQSNGFDLEAEIAGQVRKKKLGHVEIPVDWSQRKGGRSKLRSLRDGAIILARIIRT